MERLLEDRAMENNIENCYYYPLIVGEGKGQKRTSDEVKGF
jgi:hypothetical protein